VRAKTGASGWLGSINADRSTIRITSFFVYGGCPLAKQ
jgi:hypothetical protein